MRSKEEIAISALKKILHWNGNSTKEYARIAYLTANEALETIEKIKTPKNEKHLIVDIKTTGEHFGISNSSLISDEIRKAINKILYDNLDHKIGREIRIDSDYEREGIS